uniref:RNA polymerase Rpb4/RPC9 core domain-containing protein n=1 Tax=Laticauda laticaudata TaxID=8630 RepID=A0A8C5WZH5_LATLA
MGNYLNKGEDIFFQVYKLLTDLKQQCKEPGKSKQSVGQQNLKTITYETLKYISKTPCKFQSPEIVRDFLIKCLLCITDIPTIHNNIVELLVFIKNTSSSEQEIPWWEGARKSVVLSEIFSNW